MAQPSLKPIAVALALSFLSAAASSNVIPGPTFGNGVAGIPVCGSSKPPTVVVNRTLADGEKWGVMHHFWATGADGFVDRMWVEYFVDGESIPSVSMQPAMSCGMGYPEVRPDGKIEYAAGGLCGKTAPVGGWWHTFPIPFYKSIVITVRANELDGPGCVGNYVNVRGTVHLPLHMPGAGWALPMGTRMHLQNNPITVHQPLSFVTLAKLPAGTKGMVFQTSWAVQSYPEGGAGKGSGYIEGCWNFYGKSNESYPGLVVGTGVEDYFDSGYYFGADSGQPKGTLFHNELSGLTLFERSNSGRETLSAYRFHNRDPLIMTDGGSLTWQVGCSRHAGATKCGNPVASTDLREEVMEAMLTNSVGRSRSGSVGRALTAINVTTSAWILVFGDVH